MAAKKKAKKRAYKRRKKAGMTPAALEGYQDGLAFASTNLGAKTGAEYLAGHQQGVAFVVKTGAIAPKKKRAYKKRAAK